ncbi:hypothetical protein BROUX41_002604 [Berkeleyomyces rouxiae]|uniref:uncharacterized protein n=1 Tax=Berkeleyomyces rouxiae TaxID=2035830 RepID=UPI003B7726D3
MHFRAVVSTAAAAAGTAVAFVDSGLSWPNLFSQAGLVPNGLTKGALAPPSPPVLVPEACPGLSPPVLAVTKHAVQDAEPFWSAACTCCASLACNATNPLSLPLSYSAPEASLQYLHLQHEEAEMANDAPIESESDSSAGPEPSAAELPWEYAAFPAGKLLSAPFKLHVRFNVELRWLWQKLQPQLRLLSAHWLRSLGMAVDQAPGSIQPEIPLAANSPHLHGSGDCGLCRRPPPSPSASESLVATLDTWAYEPRIRCSASDVGLLLSLGALVSISALMGALMMPDRGD